MSTLVEGWIFITSILTTMLGAIVPLLVGVLVISALIDIWLPLGITLALPIMALAIVLFFAVFHLGWSWIDHRFGLEDMD